jgi:hypothetical protein
MISLTAGVVSSLQMIPRLQYPLIPHLSASLYVNKLAHNHTLVRERMGRLQLIPYGVTGFDYIDLDTFPHNEKTITLTVQTLRFSTLF